MTTTTTITLQRRSRTVEYTPAQVGAMARQHGRSEIDRRSVEARGVPLSADEWSAVDAADAEFAAEREAKAAEREALLADRIQELRDRGATEAEATGWLAGQRKFVVSRRGTVAAVVDGKAVALTRRQCELLGREPGPGNV